MLGKEGRLGGRGGKSESKEAGDKKRMRRNRHEEQYVLHFLLSPFSDEETNSYCHLRDAGKSDSRSRFLCLPALRLRRDDKGHFHAQASVSVTSSSSSFSSFSSSRF